MQCNVTSDFSSNIAALGVKTFTLSEETQVRVMVVANASESYTASIQIEQGSAATAYEPYQGDTYTALAAALAAVFHLATILPRNKTIVTE